ncbi:DNA/RNA endonuclease [candidate division KSB1 bacterium 4572_119]|nr:MAG: DNA/RNA endonuclease [candidate division KSB1 bacterium 4572_119]
MKKIIILIVILLLILLVVFCYMRINEQVAVETETLMPAQPGLPSEVGGNQVIEHNYYTLSYNEQLEQPDWVMYKLTSASLTGETFKRKDDFRVDSLVATGSATLKDYKGSGFDRGHLCPAADMAWSKQSLSETFYMSNMSPQKPRFNRGIWKKLETRVRKWAIENEEIYVVTGPVFSDNLDAIGQNEVAVPEYYYKIIYDYIEPEIKAIGFVMKNESSKEPLFNFAVTVDSVENLTNIDFFSSLPDYFENEIESHLNTRLWQIEK